VNTADLGPVCPRGHSGPWRYVESIEVWREVMEAKSGLLRVAPEWHTGEGYDEGVPGTAYLLCWAGMEGGGRCVERVELPDATAIAWE